MTDPSPGATAANDPVEAGKTLSVIAHVGFFLLAVVLALIIRLTEGRTNAFTRHHSTEALNFQLTFVLVWVALVGSFVVGIRAGWFDSTDETFEESTNAWVVLPLSLLLASLALGAIVSALGAVRAGQGRWWRYPVSIRFVRGAQASATRSSRSSLQ